MSTAIDVLELLFSLSVAILIVRYAQGKIDSSGTLGKAIAYLYH